MTFYDPPYARDEYGRAHWSTEWRALRDTRPYRVHREVSFLERDRSSYFMPDEWEHPLDDHLARHADAIQNMLHSIDTPDGGELTNRATSARLGEFLAESTHLHAIARERGANTYLADQLAKRIEEAVEWLQLAAAAQRLCNDDPTWEHCRTCEHWETRNADTDGFCVKRSHYRTGDSNACTDYGRAEALEVKL